MKRERRWRTKKGVLVSGFYDRSCLPANGQVDQMRDGHDFTGFG